MRDIAAGWDTVATAPIAQGSGAPQWIALLVVLAATGVALYVVVQAVRSVQNEGDVRYRRTEAWLSIYSVVQPRLPLPPIEPYMATPELLRHVLHLTLDRKPRLIVELGSGLSTLIAAYGAERLGECQIVSVDHEARYRDATRALLTSHGLDHRVRLIHAPLVKVEFGAHRSRWYDPEVVNAAIQEAGADIGLLLVDGPPGMDQRLARLPAVPLLHPRLAPDCTVLVDDARRPDEQEMVRLWMQQFPGFSAREYTTEKGAIVLRREGAPT